MRPKMIMCSIYDANGAQSLFLFLLMLSEEGRMPIYGLLISTLIGLMVVIGDETLTKTPTLNVRTGETKSF